MFKDHAEDFLRSLGELFQEHTTECVIEEDEKGPILIMNAQSPFNEDDDIIYSVQVEDGNNGFVLIEFVIVFFTDVSPELFEDVKKAICYIDPTLTMGNYLLAEEGGMILFRQSCILDENISSETATCYSIRNMFLMERNLFSSGQQLNELINGKITPEEIKVATTSE